MKECEKSAIKINPSSTNIDIKNSPQQQNIKPTIINLNEQKKLERIGKLRCMNDLLKVIETHHPTFEEKKT